MATKPKLPLLNIVSSALLLALPILSTPAMAEEFLCDATQASTNELPTLDESCPIGKGLWGSAKPRAQESQFWLQCGVFGQPLSLAKGKALYKHITTDVWVKPEQKGYRCLIGPYKNFTQAKQELAKVKMEPGYKDAFIREVVKGATNAVAASTQPSPSPKVSPFRIEKSSQTQTSTVIPAPVVAQEPIVRNAPQTEVLNEESEISIRLSTRIGSTDYKVPYLLFGDEQFYMEHKLPWNRMDYDQASNICNRLGMRLANADEWTTLLESNVMVQDKWPMHLPYWGTEKVGLFTSGKVNQLKGTSLLNVVCVK